MRKSTSGFTIVELLVVIAVIGILTTITLIGFTRYQMSNRDTERESKTTVLAEALEKYYDNNGEYPGCTAVNGANTATISQNVLLGVESKTYLTPKSAAGNTNSIECMNITGAASEADVYAYVGDGSAACNTGTGKSASCLSWTLKYKEESTNSIKSLKSRRATDITTSGTLAVATNIVGFTQINTSWGAIPNALSYELQWATDASFSSPGTQTVSSTSLPITELTFDTQYFFRVRANAAVNKGEWSATATARTWGLSTPNLVASTTTSTSMTASWGGILHASSYIAQCSSNGTTWGAGCNAPTAATSFVFGSAAQGTKYYFRVQAVNGSYASAWSNIDDTITTINKPAAYTMDYGNTSARWNFLDATSNAVCPAGTTPNYKWKLNGADWLAGTEHKNVSSQYGGWNQDKTISVETKCTTAATASSFVAANNTGYNALTWPTAWTWLPGDSIMYWGGTCPTYTTSNNFYWRTNGRIGASGNTPRSAYSDPATTYTGSNWGDGMARVTLSCNGPWGTASIDGTSSYGPGCVPTIKFAVCTQG